MLGSTKRASRPASSPPFRPSPRLLHGSFRTFFTQAHAPHYRLSPPCHPVPVSALAATLGRGCKSSSSSAAVPISLLYAHPHHVEQAPRSSPYIGHHSRLCFAAASSIFVGLLAIGYGARAPCPASGDVDAAIVGVPVRQLLTRWSHAISVHRVHPGACCNLQVQHHHGRPRVFDLSWQPRLVTHMYYLPNPRIDVVPLSFIEAYTQHLQDFS
ncbi:hypothetical protein B0H13DRAFT_535946 [Mycena leptocephala]|nr:hypothetical protein B0H13DRAFT_535946 [Mycena leptocephala]